MRGDCRHPGRLLAAGRWLRASSGRSQVGRRGRGGVGVGGGARRGGGDGVGCVGCGVWVAQRGEEGREVEELEGQTLLGPEGEVLGDLEGG